MGDKSCTQVELLQGIPQELGGLEEIQILPVELAFSQNLPPSQRKQLKCQAPSFSVIGEHVNIILITLNRLLLRGQIPDHLNPVTIEGGCFVMLSLGGFQHVLSQIANQLFILPFQEQGHMFDGLPVLLLSTETQNAGTQAAVDIVFQTGTIQVSVDIQVAGAQKKVAVDDFDRVARQRRR